MKILRVISFILVLMNFNELMPQEVIHKAFLEKEKLFGQEIKEITIVGEKASISVRGWNGNHIKTILRPVARNMDKDIAISDLKYIGFYADQEGDKLVVRSFFKGNAEKVKSNLSIEIEMLVPNGIPLAITNFYGSVIVENIFNADVDVSFGSIKMKDIKQSGRIVSRYSDIEGINMNGMLDIHSEKSDIILKGLNAATEVSSSYGKAEIELIGNSPVTIHGFRTTIEIGVDDFEKFNYRLSAREGEIILPYRNYNKMETLEINNPGAGNLVDISTSYCDISITTK